MTQFSDARSKIARARTHVAELQNVVTDHIATNPIVFHPLIRMPNGQNELKFTTPPAPPDAPAILGDVIHNARTALDLMANELARRKTGTDKGVSFPFATDASALPEQIRKKCFKKCGQDAVHLLYKIAPYKGGNDGLRELHDLDIQDKHRSLIPVAQLRHQIRFNILTGKVPEGDERAYWFTFPTTSLFAGKEVVAVANRLVELSEQVIVSFEALP